MEDEKNPPYLRGGILTYNVHLIKQNEETMGNRYNKIDIYTRELYVKWHIPVRARSASPSLTPDPGRE